jgi:TonB family protein
VFTGNISDRLHRRVVPSQLTTSNPDHGFWQDIDLCTPVPRHGLLGSIFSHAALLALLYAISIWPTARLVDSFSRRPLDAYTLSPYLPELHGAPAHPHIRGKSDPVLARQEILSLPANPDNLRQTVVTPPKVELKQDLALPNLVAFGNTPPLQPLAASERATSSLHLPKGMPTPDVVAPAADTAALHSIRRLHGFQPQVVEPSPDVTAANSRPALPALQPKVVEPVPDLGHLSHGSSTNLARLAPRVAAPVIPDAPQIADAQHSSAQFIVLNLHPAEVHAPVEVPSGNRRGAFAASPIGHPQATGTPGADEAIAGDGAAAPQAPFNAPAGINVAAVAAPTTPAPDAPQAATAASDLAALHAAPSPSIPPHQPLARESNEQRTELENRIFAGRRSYTLSVNMPNLNAATGSWIIHFAERDAGPLAIPIAAPEVLSKFDPAYPGDLIHDGVQGTVVLTAIIHADGSVGDIAIVKSLDPRLDQNAAEAFSRWLFRPAIKNGQKIDLEAVVTVPFHAKTGGF